AKEHALEQERQLYLKSNQKTYATLRMGILRRLIKRPEAVDTRDVGIDGQYTARKQNIILESGQLALLDSLVMTQEQQTLHGYPTSIPEPSDALLVDHRQCDRCSNRYMIRDNHNSACTFHWSRMRSDKRDGQKIRLYRCCGQEKGSPGCSTGPHVFKLSDFSDLHTFVPFTRLSKTEKPMRLMALDCEMAYTEAGMELIRVTCLDHNGNIKLDELVKTQYPVLDLNSKWSGITSLETATKDLDDIKQQLSGLIDQTTILLGHGLENDLIALRLVHDSVIDTAQLFPHPTGLPFRYALRELSKQHLHRFIQDSSAGHDSKEDAMTCL
ncbi:ribonuclease H-like domain-containing protein, partial [Gorgonomyces haynaldii]